MAKSYGIRQYKKLTAELAKLKEAPKTVISRTLSDVKKRGPSWIAAGVADRYNVKKSEVTNNSIGNLKFTGNSTDDLQLTYSGRRLTPVHFGMTPKAPKDGRGYTLKFSVLKGGKKAVSKVGKPSKKQRQNIGRNFKRQGTRNSPKSPWMLMSTGAKSEDKVQYIPFQRTKQPGGFDRVIKTISLPQMVTDGKNGPMRPEVAKRFYNGFEARLENHMKLLKK